MSATKDDITLEEAQAEFAENEKRMAELQLRNAALEGILEAKGGSSQVKKRALQDVSNNQASNKKLKKIPTLSQIESQVTSVRRKVQGQINAKLKWTNSMAGMKRTDVKKGCRIEVVCKHPQVFQRIFGDATIKTGKNGKLSCSFKTDDEVYYLPFEGKKYRYSRAELRAPCSASFNEGALVFSFKYCIK